MGKKLPTKYNGVSTVTSFNNSSKIQHVYAMFNSYITSFSSTIKLQVGKISKSFQSPVQINWVSKISKNFQSSNQVNLEWKKISEIFSKFTSVYENPEKRISKFKVQNAWWWNFRKFWKYSKSRQEVTIQNGCFEKKNFKVETQIWLNKIQKIKIKSKFRLTVIFSKFPWKYNWTHYNFTVGYTLGFDKTISTQIKFHVQMYKYLNSNSDAMCKMYKFKHKFNQVLYASHVSFTIQNGWRK